MCFSIRNVCPRTSTPRDSTRGFICSPVCPLVHRSIGPLVLRSVSQSVRQSTGPVSGRGLGVVQHWPPVREAGLLVFPLSCPIKNLWWMERPINVPTDQWTNGPTDQRTDTTSYRDAFSHLKNNCPFFGTMNFYLHIADYKDYLSDVSSPIWVWFAKKEQKDVSCWICNATIKRN